MEEDKHFLNQEIRNDGDFELADPFISLQEEADNGGETIDGYGEAYVPPDGFVRVSKHDKIKEDGKYLFFGSYPQTCIKKRAIREELNTMSGDLPTESNAHAWKSYGYYANGDNSTDFMWYIDLSYNGEKYRGVYFSSYRPYYTSDIGSVDKTYQRSNGYKKGKVYWFRYEPIKWRILFESKGEAIILCEKIIDSQEFCHYTKYDQFEHNGGTGYANNYVLSSIRKWLNDTFYKTAFTKLQQERILLTTVDNNARIASDLDNNEDQATTYACEDTDDYVYLLSLQEVTNTAYGFDKSYDSWDAARRKQNTGYARCQGAYTESFGSFLKYDTEKGYWWLRSPHYDGSNGARRVRFDGYADFGSDVSATDNGVAPALKIKLK